MNAPRYYFNMMNAGTYSVPANAAQRLRAGPRDPDAFVKLYIDIGVQEENRTRTPANWLQTASNYALEELPRRLAALLDVDIDLDDLLANDVVYLIGRLQEYEGEAKANHGRAVQDLDARQAMVSIRFCAMQAKALFLTEEKHTHAAANHDANPLERLVALARVKEIGEAGMKEYVKTLSYVSSLAVKSNHPEWFRNTLEQILIESLVAPLGVPEPEVCNEPAH